ncbi:secreted RxLR effector protein 161-like [Malus domestica]|uniref:secreted RxLR effector protein 161-like n=1 Tax=Malus domestica TaxID=3750 RepID=UPI003974DD31
MVEFDMTDLGKMRYFLGIEMIQRSDGIFISQRKYAEEVLERFNMDRCNSLLNPVVPGFKLRKDEEGVEVDGTVYNLISRYMECPTESHLQAAKRALRYVNGTIDLRTFYKKRGAEKLIGYTNSNYASDQDDRKSTSGYVFIMSLGAVSWSLKKWPVVTLSTTEAEFIAESLSAC